MMYSKFTFGAISNSDRSKTHKHSLGLYSLPISEHNLEGVHWYAKSRQLQARMQATENNGATDTTSLDMNMGYYHICLSAEAPDMCTIITEFGKYRYKRLLMGVSCSPDIFKPKSMNN